MPVSLCLQPAPRLPQHTGSHSGNAVHGQPAGVQTTWGAGQAQGSSLAAPGARKNGAGGKSAGKRLLKRAAKNSVDLDDYEEEQDHLDACFKDSDYGECCCAGRGACPGCWEPDPLADVIHRP